MKRLQQILRILLISIVFMCCFFAGTQIGHHRVVTKWQQDILPPAAAMNVLSEKGVRESIKHDPKQRVSPF